MYSVESVEQTHYESLKGANSAKEYNTTMYLILEVQTGSPTDQNTHAAC